MTVPVTFHPGADRDLVEAAEYYLRVDLRLAAAFLSEIERSIQAIHDRPKASALISRNTRRRLAHRFPYSVVYREHLHEIRILAIAHVKRRPFYWAGRV